jgi:hypothetical protein
VREGEHVELSLRRAALFRVAPAVRFRSPVIARIWTVREIGARQARLRSLGHQVSPEACSLGVRANDVETLCSVPHVDSPRATPGRDAEAAHRNPRAIANVGQILHARTHRSGIPQRV